jgi:hypothetical protein
MQGFAHIDDRNAPVFEETTPYIKVALGLISLGLPFVYHSQSQRSDIGGNIHPNQ